MRDPQSRDRASSSLSTFDEAPLSHPPICKLLAFKVLESAGHLNLPVPCRRWQTHSSFLGQFVSLLCSPPPVPGPLCPTSHTLLHSWCSVCLFHYIRATLYHPTQPVGLTELPSPQSCAPATARPARVSALLFPQHTSTCYRPASPTPETILAAVFLGGGPLPPMSGCVSALMLWLLLLQP